MSESLSNGELVPGVTVFDDLEPRTHTFRIRGKEYVVRSAATGAAVKYRNACSRAAKWDGDPDSGKMKVVGFDGLADTEVLLVHLCTFEVIKTATGEVRHGPVARGWVETLPPQVTKAMFDKIVEISPYLSGVGESLGNRPVAPADQQNDWPEEPLPKGSQGSTTDTSS